MTEEPSCSRVRISFFQQSGSNAYSTARDAVDASAAMPAAGVVTDLDLSSRSTGNSSCSLSQHHRVSHQDTAFLQDDLPHVDDCGVCMRCVVDTPPKPLGMRIEELKEEHFMPMDVREKQLKPVCEACRGCTHELTLLVSWSWRRAGCVTAGPFAFQASVLYLQAKHVK